MDDHTDDRDPDRPPVGTPKELEEALKWLEELTARQGKPADVANPTPAASLDSPFRGLIDSEEGDLPDWLRELPQSHVDDGEPESRLDWLAKMAQQESIEELPTLEWRRLSEPAKSAILGDQSIEMPTEHYAGPIHDENPELDSLEELTIEAFEEGVAESPIQPGTDMPEESPDEISEAPHTEVPLADRVEPAEISVSDELEPHETTPIESGVDTDHPDEEFVIPPIAPVTMGLDEILVEDRLAEEVAELYAEEPADLDLPLDDLDAAMAWIEELAASQNAPVEDVPSVADRALASKLMVEAGLTPNVSPLDELGSDSDLIEGRTPTHPFIDEEDFADTVVLVETLAADQGVTLEPVRESEDSPEYEAEAIAVQQTIESTDPQEHATDFDEFTAWDETTGELSFEEAMAILDEIAATPTDVEDEFVEPIVRDVESQISSEVAGVEGPLELEVFELQEEGYPELDVEEGLLSLDVREPDEENFESFSTEEVPWVDSPAQQIMVVSLVDDAANLDTDQLAVEGLNGTGYGELEMALLSLDALALPPGKTLEDVAARLTAAHMASWRDVDSALNWLEQTLNTPAIPPVMTSVELDDTSLIEQMPEDPDAVLAWLELIAAQQDAQTTEVDIVREEASGVVIERAQSEPLVEELAEADLFDMPDDPDEAMAWLEGLARGNHPAQHAAEGHEDDGSRQQAESTEAAPVIAKEIASAIPEAAEFEDQLVDAANAEVPEIEVFVDQEGMTIDTNAGDFAASVSVEPFTGEYVTAEVNELVEGGNPSVESQEIGEYVREISAAHEVTLDGEPLEAEIEATNWPEQEAGVSEPDRIIPPIVEAAAIETDMVDERYEPTASVELSEHLNEETRAEAEPAEDSVPAPQAERHLPSWLDLLKPLD